VKPLNQSVFKGHRWTFQQDSAPAHKAKITENWLQKEVPDFISYLEWPAFSADLNPLDYKIWSKLEEMACSRPHTSVEALKQSLVKVWESFPIDVVRAATSEWRPRLRACVKAISKHFEV
jgi:inhibitor of nuclear factor kappa-B kinase subunit alpha